MGEPSVVAEALRYPSARALADLCDEGASLEPGGPRTEMEKFLAEIEHLSRRWW